MVNEIFRNDEKAAMNLRALYEQFGYKQFRMSKFEAYDLYLENKSFLSGGDIITFHDTHGKLMALKPDVTLSIVKNARRGAEEPIKQYYCENVYRVADGEFKEIMQTGVEYIGRLNDYCIYEVILLAKKSLRTISEESILDVSNMDFIVGFLNGLDLPLSVGEKAVEFISRKNTHGLKGLCEEWGVSQENRERLCRMASLYAPLRQGIEEARSLVCNKAMEDALSELERLYDFLLQVGEADSVNLDFSIINDLSYYNGIIFQGFVSRIPKAVLSGGRYDKLLNKMQKDMGAIGFAVYMDLLNLYYSEKPEYDVDILITAQEDADPVALYKAVKMFIDGGQSVRVQKKDMGTIKYKQLLHFTQRGMEIVEGND